MHHVLVVGGGKMGSLITMLLARSSDYRVCLADLDFTSAEHARLRTVLPELETVTIDVTDEEAMGKFLKDTPMQAVISSLPYFCNPPVAKIARTHNLHYFDLTEDVEVTQTVSALAKDAKTAFVSQCGLAPGFVGIVANSLMQRFDEIDTVKLRVGALPANASNALQYALTWSTDGIINEYGNPCFGIEHGKRAVFLPLEGLELHQIDGLSYEAFRTSGGLGSLAESYIGKVKTMNYKTLRYPGHCEKIRFLMNDLRLNEDRATLKRLFERALPKTYQDVVVLYVSVNGVRHGEFVEENFVKKFYPKEIGGIPWSAIQVTTAASLCAVADIVLRQNDDYKGYVLQEHFPLEKILQNSFGKELL